MRINNLSLPHPVLGIEDDVTGTYSVECSVSLTPEKATLSIKQHLSNKTLSEMIASEEAVFNVEAHSRQTFYRKAFVSDKSDYDIEIPVELLRNRVDVNFYIVSTIDKDDYKIEGSNRDYGENNFMIRKGDVLASGGSTWFPALKDWRALKAADSFITIDKGDFKEGTVNIFLDRDKIGIELSKKDYQTYSNLCRRTNLYPIFHSSFVFPALLHVLSQLKENQSDFMAYQWFTALAFRKENESELSNLDWNEEINFPKIAQILLSNPIDRMLNASEALIKLTEPEE